MGVNDVRAKLILLAITYQLDGMSRHDLYEEKATHDPIVEGYGYEERLGVYLTAQNSYFPTSPSYSARKNQR